MTADVLALVLHAMQQHGNKLLATIENLNADLLAELSAIRQDLDTIVTALTMHTTPDASNGSHDPTPPTP